MGMSPCFRGEASCADEPQQIYGYLPGSMATTGRLPVLYASNASGSTRQTFLAVEIPPGKKSLKSTGNPLDE